MKPRTKLHFEVIRNSQQLWKIDNDILSWAKVECLDHKGFATKTKVVCMDCGNTFSPELVNRKRAICPHCDVKLHITQTRKTTDNQKCYVASAEIYNEFQVIRNFEISACYKAGNVSSYHCREILQHWILPNGKYESYGKNHTLNYHCDSWNGPMEIRKSYTKYYQSANKYDVYPCKYHPDSKFKTEYRKYGINKKLEGLTFLEAIKLVPNNPKSETLLKAKRYDLLSCYDDYNLKHAIYNHWSSIKICLRTKYKIKDTKIWFDYLDLLRNFNKDLHNAHYVCPKNLKKEHDKLVKKKRSIQQKQQAELKRKKLLQDEKTFQNLRSAFFGICFSSQDIEIRIIESVKEIMEEGDILHHCVFTNEYYLKEDSLILSATVNGKKTETVEVSLSKLQVVQCRGLQNNNSKYHDQIIELVNKNMRLIKEKINTKKKRASKRDVSQLRQIVT